MEAHVREPRLRESELVGENQIATTRHATAATDDDVVAAGSG